MKKVSVFLLALAASVLTISAADNVANKTVSVQSKARIIVPITLANTGSQALDFGYIARGTTGSSTIVLSAASTPAVTVTGDAIALNTTTPTAAKFTVGGESGKTYAITIPTTTQTITGGGSTLNLTAFSCSTVSLTGSIGTNDVFYVGATLTVPSAAVAASYTGSFSVTVAYN